MEFRKKGLLFVVVAFANFVTLLGIVQILSVFHEVCFFFFSDTFLYLSTSKMERKER